MFCFWDTFSNCNISNDKPLQACITHDRHLFAYFMVATATQPIMIFFLCSKHMWQSGARLKRNSAKYPTTCFWERPKRGMQPRTSRHKRSMCWVWAPESGSTKFWEWLTLWCWKPSEDRQLYARQQSDVIVVPGRIHVLITERRVSESLDSTGTRKVSPVPH